MIHLLTFLLSMAIWVWLRYRDHSLSLKFPFYGLEEANSLMRDKYGFYVGGLRGLAPDFIVAIFFIAGFLVLTQEWAWVAPAAGSAVSFFVIQRNKKSMRSQRTRQIATLKQLAAISIDEEFTLTLAITSRIDRHWFSLFPWIDESAQGPLLDSGEIERAARVLSRKLHALAIQSESQWFPA